METTEEKKNWLKSYQRTKRELIRLNEELKELRSIEDSIKSSGNLSDMPKHSGGTDMSDRVIKRLQMERKLEQKICKAYMLMSDIEEAIEALKDVEERQVLTLRYISGHTWEETCEIMGRSWTHVVNDKHRTALKNLKKKRK